MTGNCTGEFTDLNWDGVPEFRTCDDHFAYAIRSFAFTPLPPVVFAFDRARQQFTLATPVYAETLPAPTDFEVRMAIIDAGDDASLVACAALRPALHAVYTGKVEGRLLLRRWYPRADVAALETRVLAIAAESPLWRR